MKLQKEILEGFGAFCHLLWTFENVVEICVERVQFIVVEEVTKMAMPRILDSTCGSRLGNWEKKNDLMM